MGTIFDYMLDFNHRLNANRQQRALIQQMRDNNQWINPKAQAYLNASRAATAGQNIKNQYLPETLQSTNNYREALIKDLPLKENLLREKLLMGGEQLLKTPQGYVRYNKDTHATVPITNSQGQAVMPLQTRQMMQFTPGIGWTINTIGINSSGQGNSPTAQENASQNSSNSIQQVMSPVSTSQLQQGEQGNIVRSPGAPQSRRTTGGSTLIDKNTGNAISIPTRQTAGKFQQAAASEEAAMPALKSIYQEASPEVGGYSGFAKRQIQSVLRGLGYKEPGLSNYQSVKTTRIPAQAEALIKAYGINATEENLNKVIKAMQFKPTDTKDSWRRRVADLVGDLAYRGTTYKKYLRSGIPLQGQPDQSSTIDKIRKDVYIGLGQSQSATPVKMPKFNSKADFQKWLLNLPAAQREQVLNQLR